MFDSLHGFNNNQQNNILERRILSSFYVWKPLKSYCSNLELPHQPQYHAH